jgi:N-acetyl-1-D-myo-inositol-2-amino-2-deoxy-alpha-D-glucopyranoside deacetylase
MSRVSAARRLLLVHAHPDDETITTGATMARYADDGAQVTLVTCTLGEEGEILVPALAGLAAEAADQLGGYRIGELTAALAALGVTDHRFLGGAGRWRDSGMMGLPQNHADRAFWRADLGEATDALVAVIRQVRPQVLVTYDESGGYGHPDHIQAHRVAMGAIATAADPSFRPDAGEPWPVAKVYWVWYGTPNGAVTTRVDASAYLPAKRAAMLAHATQITVTGSAFALSNGIKQPLSGVEYYRLAPGSVGSSGAGGAEGWEADLFAGLV